MEQVYTPKQNYKVLVRTITYNQAKYITDTLDGVAMQQTNFPFVHYVIDDCSTDGEQEVIKSWINVHCDMATAEYIDLELANVILVPHKTNINLTYAIYFLKRNLYKERVLKDTLVSPWRDHCEYEALCEGDDYWTEALKLQMQVDILDNNSEIAVVHAQAKVWSEENHLFSNSILGRDSNDFIELLFNNTICTLTTCSRISCIKEYCRDILPVAELKSWKMGDYPMWLWFAANYKVGFINIKMGVYRELPNSASHSKDINKSISFNESLKDIRLFFNSLYGEESLTQLIMSQHNASLAYIYISSHSYRKAVNMLKLISWKMRLSVLAAYMKAQLSLIVKKIRSYNEK